MQSALLEAAISSSEILSALALSAIDHGGNLERNLGAGPDGRDG